MQNDLLSQLHDIHAIDTVDWWPLAIGWWLLIALIMATLLCVYGVAMYKKRQAQRWQKQADAILQDVENEADPQKKHKHYQNYCVVWLFRNMVEKAVLDYTGISGCNG